MREEWVRSLRDRCEDAGVDFFFKQWGGVSKKQTGRTLDGRTYDAIPTASPHRMMDIPVRLTHLQRFELQLEKRK